jgi:hypothetical protein
MVHPGLRTRGSLAVEEAAPGADAAINISDTASGQTVSLSFSNAPTPEPTSEDQFLYPVDLAFKATVESLTISPSSFAVIHTEDTSVGVQQTQSKQFGSVGVEVEVSATVKLYFKTKGPITVAHTSAGTKLKFERPTPIAVGAHSYHTAPSDEITIPATTDGLIQAVSSLGHTIKTTKSERSYPTLRGHPPQVRIGETTQIPDQLSPQATDITITAPRDPDTLFALAPLAYYLSAPVTAGQTPALHLPDNTINLTGAPNAPHSAEQTLKQIFFMDCLVRGADKKHPKLHRWDELNRLLPVSLEDLHGRPSSARISQYLTVDYETIDPYLPIWDAIAHVTPTIQEASLLPYMLNQLAVVRPGEPQDGVSIDSGQRIPDVSGPTAADRPGKTQQTTSSPAIESDGSGATVSTDGIASNTEALNRIWAGDGTTGTAQKAILEGYENRLEIDDNADTIDIAVVCNDSTMQEEHLSAQETYVSRKEQSLSVDFYTATSTNELKSVFTSNYQYLHYIGHIGDEGFQCADGYLDISTLGEVNVDTAFFNACKSYEQGRAFIERGAIAAIVTSNKIIDSCALKIGRTIARLLQLGWPLNAALEVSRHRGYMNQSYLTIGNATFRVVQHQQLNPRLTVVQPTNSGTYLVWTKSYTTRNIGIGSEFKHSVVFDENVYLVPNTTKAVDVTAETLKEHLAYYEEAPVLFEGDLRWPSELVDEL